MSHHPDVKWWTVQVNTVCRVQEEAWVATDPWQELGEWGLAHSRDPVDVSWWQWPSSSGQSTAGGCGWGLRSAKTHTPADQTQTSLVTVKPGHISWGDRTIVVFDGKFAWFSNRAAAALGALFWKFNDHIRGDRWADNPCTLL